MPAIQFVLELLTVILLFFLFPFILLLLIIIIILIIVSFMLFYSLSRLRIPNTLFFFLLIILLTILFLFLKHKFFNFPIFMIPLTILTGYNMYLIPISDSRCTLNFYYIRLYLYRFVILLFYCFVS